MSSLDPNRLPPTDPILSAQTVRGPSDTPGPLTWVNMPAQGTSLTPDPDRQPPTEPVETAAYVSGPPENTVSLAGIILTPQTVPTTGILGQLVFDGTNLWLYNGTWNKITSLV
jgi:hypothetical protein